MCSMISAIAERQSIGFFERAKNKVSAAALPIFKELAASLCLAGIVACFTATANIPILFQTVAIQCAFSSLFHLCNQKWLASFNFALFSGYNMQTLIHEAGHALAAISLYAKALPHIEIIPFGSAITQFQKGPLSAFGKLLGASKTACLVIASGPALAILTSTAFLCIGLHLKNKYLISWSYLDFALTAHYAYTAIDNNSFNFSHDFVHLSVFGLSPMLATVGIIALPIITTLWYHEFFLRRADGIQETAK